MEADYSKYLSSLYTGTSWSVTRLSGGLVNTTLRATQTSPVQSDVPTSVILKHAKPYVEVAGPEWTFSTKRQEVEAIFLNLFSEHGALSYLRKEPYWNSPRCLHHREGKESDLGLSSSDQEASVLILSDLGNLVNIFDFICQQSHRPWDEVRPKVEKLGYDLGRIFAAIHSPERVIRVQTSNPQAAAKLTHSLTRDIVRTAAIEPLRTRLASTPNANKLFARVEEGFRAQEGAHPWSLAMGDFTQGSILMRDPSEAEEDWTPTLVDWEFGQLNGRGVDGDLAQFLAHLHCELLSRPRTSALHRAVSALSLRFCAGYASRAGLRLRRRADDETLRLMRWAFITHGREMVNQACESYKGNERFDEIFKVGVWYLERAGDNVEEFLEEDNWKELEKEDGMMLQSLFEVL
ncbi:hypothetical protein NCS57_00454300 [Fusarium keratoplasticum]|uniref:Uncharacterized protein n=1 Tax=Fusarium keratoplasticum TaxID=1328300 RepID=A0ACC0R761_9HYPO|nr:hypothetical protein NCS57_00454300 [Fusarium keratoplasticum]KAI8675529.1 hypothetical protein NCS57_00454300 [Fusarium keratoplasticum]KAI8681989.1 hypothetical protein NCS55_00452900 [Fusarium keratoplasticum]